MQNKEYKQFIRKIQNVFLAVFFVLAFLLSVYSAAGLRINEIMHNPYGSDESEYIEIYEDGCANVAELKLFENNVSHGITFIENNSVFCGYAVIVSNPDYFLSAFNITNTSIIAKSSFSLSNSGEFIALKNSTSTIDAVDYKNFIEFSNGNGKSLEFFNNSWHESIANGTPGAGNSVGMNFSFIVNLTFEENQTNETSQTNFTNQTNQTNPLNLSGQVNQTNTTQTIPAQTNTTQSPISIQTSQCNVTIGISAQDIFEDDKIKFYNTLSNAFPGSSYDFEIEYWIEDLEGNIVKNRAVTANLQQKSWTAGRKSAYIIKNKLKWTDCNSTSAKTSAEKVIVLRNNNAEETAVKNDTKQNQSFQNESRITIPEIGEEIKFNNSFEAMIVIYKGNTLKSSVSVWIENKTAKLSAVEKFSIPQKFSENEVIAEINMKSIKSCSQTQAMLVAEGLGIIARKNITIDIPETCLSKQGSNVTEVSLGISDAGKGIVAGPVIEEKDLASGSANVSMPYFSRTGQTESNLNNESVENIKKGAVIVYESPLEKSKKYLNFGIAGLFILLLVILWKSGKGTKISETSEQKPKNERTGYKRKNFRRMDTRQGYLRDAWEAKRARRDNAEGICQTDKGAGKESCND